jgi:uncharacterized phage-associated protein
MGMIISHSFDARRAGQIAAFFTKREGGLINVVKLVKLIYLADRAYMALYEEPMFMDNFVFDVELGPVNSGAYECVNSGCDGWDEFISGRENHNVALTVGSVSEDDLDELSTADLEVLNEIWNEFGHMSQWDLVEHTHKYCPEWKDPGNSSVAIPYGRVFKFLKKDNSEKLANNIQERKRLDENFVSFQMTIIPERGMAILVPSGPGEDQKHLHVILSPVCVSGCHLVVPIQTVYPGEYYDQTCLLHEGDHPFITHLSWVAYRHSHALLHSGMIKEFANFTYIVKDPVGKDLLDRICGGLFISPRASKKIQKYFLSTSTQPDDPASK